MFLLKGDAQQHVRIWLIPLIGVHRAVCFFPLSLPYDSLAIDSWNACLGIIWFVSHVMGIPEYSAASFMMSIFFGKQMVIADVACEKCWNLNHFTGGDSWHLKTSWAGYKPATIAAITIETNLPCSKAIQKVCLVHGSSISWPILQLAENWEIHNSCTPLYLNTQEAGRADLLWETTSCIMRNHELHWKTTKPPILFNRLHGASKTTFLERELQNIYCHIWQRNTKRRWRNLNVSYIKSELIRNRMVSKSMISTPKALFTVVSSVTSTMKDRLFAWSVCFLALIIKD